MRASSVARRERDQPRSGWSQFGTTGKDGAPQLVIKVSDEAKAKKALGLS